MTDDVDPLALGGEDSPWAHDVPIPPPPALPASWERRSDVAESAVDEPPVHDEPVPPATADHRRRLVAVVALLALVASAVVVARLVAGGADTQTAERDPAADTTENTVARSTTTERPQRPSTTVAATLPEPPPTWRTRGIEVAPRFEAMTPGTELVVRTRDGTLHVVDLAQGVVHSIDTGETPNYSMMVVGSDTIVLSPFSVQDPIRVLRPGGSEVKIDPPDGPSQVTARRGTDSFVVTPTYWSDERPPTYVMSADGSLELVEDGPLADVEPWRIHFLPTTGELLFTDAGGTYAIDDFGAARRISGGDLIAVGLNHFVVRVCDETLTCGYELVDARTGENSPALLADLDGYPPLDGNASLSPDGTKLVYLAYRNGPPKRRIIDLATGRSFEVAESEQSLTNSMWASDGSGLFVVDDGEVVFVDASTGEPTRVTTEDVFASVVEVAVR